MDTVRADSERRARIGTANGVRRLTGEELLRVVERMPLPAFRQDVVVRVLGGTAATVTLDVVEWASLAGRPFTVALDKVDDLGPADQLLTLNRTRWRDEFAGCRRVLVAWDAWAAHLVAARATA